MLIPDNFWGNRLTEQVEFVYKNWVSQYKGYVQTTIDKHRNYANTKQFTHEAYLDIKDFSQILMFIVFMRRYWAVFHSV